MVKEELYIIVDGERKQLDLTSPSGITLNFVSNLFNDLSKINASYSYTFKLPRTANNVRVLELADDVRADGKFTRIKNDAEYVYDGVSLFSNANMYISGVEKESISAVMTWNVNKGLQELEKHDMSLQELGNHLPEGEYDYVGDEVSDYEKDKVVPIGEGTYDDHSSTPTEYRAHHHSQSRIRPVFTKYTNYNPHNSYYASIHNGGIPPYQLIPELVHSAQGEMHFNKTYPLYEDSADGKLSPMDFFGSDDTVEAKRLPSYPEEEAKTYIDDKGNCQYPTFAVPAPIIPVPYLLDIISKVFGIKLDLQGEKYNSLCVPLVTTEMTDGLARRNYIRLSFGVDHTCLGITAAVIYLYTPNVNTLSDAQIEGIEMSDWSHTTVQNVVTCNTVIDRHSKMKILVSGKITVKVEALGGMHSYDDNTKPTFTFWCQTYETDKKFYKVGSVYASKWSWHFVSEGTSYEELVFNCDPAEGFKMFESEELYRPSICMTLTYGEPKDTPNELPDTVYKVLDVTGEFRLSFKVAEYPMGCHINLFRNLPDISCLDFVKSIFYALGGYPYQDPEGNIKMQRYEDIVQKVIVGNVYDWSNKILTERISDDDFNYEASNVTGLTLAQKNYFLMKNDKIDDYGNEEKNDKLKTAYEHGYNCIDIASDLFSEKTQTLYSFPFYGGFLWQEGYYRNLEFIHTLPLATNRIESQMGLEFYEGTMTIVSLIGQDRWQSGDKGYKSTEAKPLLGIIQPINVPVASFSEIVNYGMGEVSVNYTIEYQHRDVQYLSMRVWNCAADMPKVNGHDLLQELFGNPCLVKEDMNLNVADLVSLDMEKPVFLEKYNSYFAIKNIEVSSSDGISKVELIRIPTEILEPAQPTPEVIVEPPTVEPTEPEPSNEPEPSASD